MADAPDRRPGVGSGRANAFAADAEYRRSSKIPAPMRWTQPNVKRLLANRAYLGEVKLNGVAYPGSHEPLVEPDLWLRAQRTGVQVRPRAEAPSPVKTLLRCAGCRMAVRSEYRPLMRGNTWYFTCRSTAGRHQWPCAEKAAIASQGELESAIAAAFFSAIPQLEARIRAADSDLNALHVNVERARASRDEFLADSSAQQRLGLESYLTVIEARNRELTDAERRLDTARLKSPGAPLTGDIVDLKTRWPDLTGGEQTELLNTVIRCVMFAGRERYAPLAGRVGIVLRGTPLDLPARGGRAWTPRPFDITDADIVL